MARGASLSISPEWPRQPDRRSSTARSLVTTNSQSRLSTAVGAIIPALSRALTASSPTGWPVYLRMLRRV